MQLAALEANRDHADVVLFVGLRVQAKTLAFFTARAAIAATSRKKVPRRFIVVPQPRTGAAN